MKSLVLTTAALLFMGLALSSCDFDNSSSSDTTMFGSLTDGAQANERFAMLLPLLLNSVQAPLQGAVVDEVRIEGTVDHASSVVSVRSHADQLPGNAHFDVTVPLDGADTPKDPGILGSTLVIDMAIKVDVSHAPMTLTFNP